MNKYIYNAITAVIAIYILLVTFVLAIGVFMSNAGSSPEVSLTATHPLRSIVLLALVAWPFVTFISWGRDTWTGRVLLLSLSLSVMSVGVVCATSSHGLFEAFSPTDGARHVTGIIYIISSIFVIGLFGWRSFAGTSTY